jgi:hypothetical protein
MLFFKRIATIRRKRSQTRYCSCYQALTVVLDLILREFVWMRLLNDQGLDDGTRREGQGLGSVGERPWNKAGRALESIRCLKLRSSVAEGLCPESRR